MSPSRQTKKKKNKKKIFTKTCGVWVMWVVCIGLDYAPLKKKMDKTRKGRGKRREVGENALKDRVVNYRECCIVRVRIFSFLKHPKKKKKEKKRIMVRDVFVRMNFELNSRQRKINTNYISKWELYFFH